MFFCLLCHFLSVVFFSNISLALYGDMTNKAILHTLMITCCVKNNEHTYDRKIKSKAYKGMSVKSTTNQTGNRNVDEMPMENLAHLSIPIENESEVIIQTERIINEEFIFSFGKKLGIYILMWHEVG